MTSVSLRSLISLIGLVIAASIPVSQAQVMADDPLAPVPGFTPIVKFTDSSVDSVLTVAGNRTLSTKSTSTVNITANITGTVLANIDGSTPFEISIGALTLAGTLSDDPNYVKGKTSFFKAFNVDGLGRPKGTTGIKLTWTATRLTVTITRAATDAMDPGPVMTTDFLGTTDPKIRKLSRAAVVFGAIASPDFRPVYVQGTSSVRMVRYGTGGSAQDFFLNTVNLTATGDFTLPTVAITSPRTGTLSSTGDIVIKGKAGDGHELAGVEFTLDPNEVVWDQAPTSPLPPALPPGALFGPHNVEWEIVFNGRPHGTNFVWVRSVDASGNRSKPVVLSFIRPVPTLLTGRWDALVEPSEPGGMRGIVTFTTDSKGAVLSGKLTVDGVAAPMPFAGTLFDTGVAATIKRARLPSILLSGMVASLDPADAAAASITGTLSIAGSGQPAATFTAFRSPWKTPTLLPAPAVGRFHAAFENSTASPVLGHSFLVIATKNTGAVSLVGSKLADGSVLTYSGVVGANGQVPVFAPLYAGKGSFSAMLNIATDTGALTSGPGVWRRPASVTDKQFPAGYELSLNLQDSSRYIPPPVKTRVLGLTDAQPILEAEWEGDAITGMLQQNVSVSATNVATSVLPVTDGFKISTITAATGIITGSFKLPGTTTVATFTALIAGSGNQAFGHYIAPAAVGSTAKRFGTITLGHP